jgi:hypothetical protein
MSYLALRIMSAMGEVIDAGENFGIFDTESRYCLEAFVELFVETGCFDTLTADLLSLYCEQPGVDEYARRLNTRFTAICTKILEATDPTGRQASQTFTQGKEKR